MSLEVYEKIADLAKQLAGAHKKVGQTSASRSALPPGSTRARVTTANARWMAACEERDRVDAEFRHVLTENGYPF